MIILDVKQMKCIQYKWILQKSEVILLGSISHVLLHDTYSISFFSRCYMVAECIWSLSVWVVDSFGVVVFNTIVLLRLFEILPAYLFII